MEKGKGGRAKTAQKDTAKFFNLKPGKEEKATAKDGLE